MKSISISALCSNSGKTVLTTALLYHFKKSVRAFKIGPDYIDPQFHSSITRNASINLDTFMMDASQVKWLFNRYSDQEMGIVEGVMGFYDGMDKGCSAYDITKLLDIPSILVIDGSGSYITISAVLKGLKTFRDDNSIKGVVLNKLSSAMHYELIKKNIENELEGIKVLGWIKKDISSLKNTHLGLDLNDMDKIEQISKEVIENIDTEAIKELAKIADTTIEAPYPFESFERFDKKLAIVKDKNFSFIYHDNIEFLKEIFKEVIFIDPSKDEMIPNDCDIVYLPGGYVETDINYKTLKDSHNFKSSLQNHAKTKYIYAECAGLLYLGNRVDDKIMSKILDIDFELKAKRSRLGYYFGSNSIKGHAFHYTKPINPPKGVDILSKKQNGKGEEGSWQKDNVYGTYLHTTFRNHFHILRRYFGV